MLSFINSIILGVVEGVTEFLPVSSTGHLTIAEKLMHLPIDDPGLTAYTAIIQVGAMLAAIIYFWKDIVRIVAGWFTGLGAVMTVLGMLCFFEPVVGAMTMGVLVGLAFIAEGVMAVLHGAESRRMLR